MSEKRFTVPENYRCIQDNLTKEHYMCEDKTEAINLAYLLNDLHEENKKLKQVNEMLQMDFAITERNLMEENEQLKQQLFYDGDDVLNELATKCSKLEKENGHLKSTIAQLIEQNRKNNDLLLSDIRILEKALWCGGCENDYGRLKELRKEFIR